MWVTSLRRDVVYEHTELIDWFKAQVKAQRSTPTTMRELADKHAAAETELARIKRKLAEERRVNALLRKAVGELSLELQQARDEAVAFGAVAQLPVARRL